MKKSFLTFLAFILVGLLLTPARGIAWGAPRIAVLYPEVREPYLTVFQNIIRGIESGSGSQVSPYPLPEDFDPAQVEKWLTARQPITVIALGSRGFQMAKALENRLPVIVGAVLLSPNGLPGISMAADPAIQFRQLKNLSPRTKRVFVVYNPEESEWLVRQAKDAARENHLQLTPYPINDLREAVTTYRDLIENTLESTDAVWLPMDEIGANDKVVLPMLLEAAWNKKFILFSSKPSHAKQGALFSLFPDNYGMGQRLAEMVEQISRGGGSANLVPSKDLQTAVNLRTAAHLGLTFSSAQTDMFQLKFP